MIKRFFLFILINFFVLLTIGFLIKLFGVDGYMYENGINYVHLFTFSVIAGFTGSFISLMLSKTIAKASTGAKVITTPYREDEVEILRTVKELADRAGVAMPEVAIYEGAPNAFATGPSKNNSLVAVSTGLLQNMPPEQIKAVLAHEMSHVVNGDMVTMTLLQGVLNTFVFFFARVIALFLQKRGNDNRKNIGLSYYFIVQAFEIVFGILASLVACAFSRHREFRADAGAVQLTGNPNAMIEALRTLSTINGKPLPSEIKAFGINGMPSFLALFSTHPPIKDRVRALSFLSAKKTGRGGVFQDISK